MTVAGPICGEFAVVVAKLCVSWGKWDVMSCGGVGGFKQVANQALAFGIALPRSIPTKLQLAAVAADERITCRGFSKGKTAHVTIGIIARW
jgi:hypothetical protein